MTKKAEELRLTQVDKVLLNLIKEVKNKIKQVDTDDIDEDSA